MPAAEALLAMQCLDRRPDAIPCNHANMITVSVVRFRPIDIIRLYRLRFKIEHSFKQAIRLIGSFAYHFWMRGMVPLRYRNGSSLTGAYLCPGFSPSCLNSLSIRYPILSGW
jgi:hypothetical protein